MRVVENPVERLKRSFQMNTTRSRASNENVIALLDGIKERVLRAIPDAKSTVLFDGLMDEAQARGLSPLECLDYIEAHRSMP